MKKILNYILQIVVASGMLVFLWGKQETLEQALLDTDMGPVKGLTIGFWALMVCVILGMLTYILKNIMYLYIGIRGEEDKWSQAFLQILRHTEMILGGVFKSVYGVLAIVFGAIINFLPGVEGRTIRTYAFGFAFIGLGVWYIYYTFYKGELKK